MKLAVLAIGTVAAAVAWLVWAASRDLREPWRLTPVPTPDPEDYMAGVQVDTRPYLVSSPLGGM